MVNCIGISSCSTIWARAALIVEIQWIKKIMEGTRTNGKRDNPTTVSDPHESGDACVETVRFLRRAREYAPKLASREKRFMCPKENCTVQTGE